MSRDTCSQCFLHKSSMATCSKIMQKSGRPLLTGQVWMSQRQNIIQARSEANTALFNPTGSRTGSSDQYPHAELKQQSTPGLMHLRERPGSSTPLTCTKLRGYRNRDPAQVSEKCLQLFKKVYIIQAGLETEVPQAI